MLYYFMSINLVKLESQVNIDEDLGKKGTFTVLVGGLESPFQKSIRQAVYTLQSIDPVSKNIL